MSIFIAFNFWYNFVVMLTTYKPQFVEKIFTDQLGQQFRLTFLVTLVNGEYRGSLVSAELISKKAGLLKGNVESDISDTPVCLPIICEQKKGDTQYISSCKEILSPFNELFFFMSQPTRAPSL